MYRLIASDLDETLLDSTRSVGIPTREAIDKARKQGVKFVIATGRPYFSVNKTQKELDLQDKEGEYTIALNGAVVVDNASGKPLYVEGLEYDVIKKLFDLSKNYDVGVHIYTDQEVYACRLSENEKQYINGRMNVIEFSDDSIDFLKDHSFVKILFVNPDQSVLDQIARDLENETKDLEVSFSSGRYLEFNKKGIHKGFGLAKLAEMLGIDISETIGIGDNFNDLAMIKTAGLGVGVANSNPGILEFCDYITENDYNHDPVKEVIEKFVLSDQD